eukprot:7231577-Pyramimonas_sp.AAC.1
MRGGSFSTDCSRFSAAHTRLKQSHHSQGFARLNTVRPQQSCRFPRSPRTDVRSRLRVVRTQQSRWPAVFWYD